MPGTRIGYLTRVIRHGPQEQPKPKPAILVHGTINGYTYHACRCEKCKTANSDHAREYRCRPKTWPKCAHGKRTTYLSGCRCRKCRGAERRYRAGWVARRAIKAREVKRG